MWSSCLHSKRPSPHLHYLRKLQLQRKIAAPVKLMAVYNKTFSFLFTACSKLNYKSCLGWLIEGLVEAPWGLLHVYKSAPKVQFICRYNVTLFQGWFAWLEKLILRGGCSAFLGGLGTCEIHVALKLFFYENDSMAKILMSACQTWSVDFKIKAN